MTTTVKRGHLDFPADWQHVESQGSGPFITRVVHQLADGSTHIWSSRRHRKGFGPEVVTPEGEAQAKKRPSLFLWAPDKLNWWITMINFVGCVAFLISAFLAFVRPDPLLDNLAIYATIFTLIGAVCFFVGAYLMWPEMSTEATENGV